MSHLHTESPRFAADSKLLAHVKAWATGTLANDPKSRAPSNSTIETQFARVNVLFRRMFPDKPVSMAAIADMLRDPEGVRKFVFETDAWKAPSSKLAHFSASAVVARYILGLESVREAYTSGQAAPAREIAEARGTGMLGLVREELYEPLETMQALARKMTNDGTRDAALMALYWGMPPRRLDPQILRISTTMENDPLYNWLVVGPKMTLIWNVFKTAKSIGQQRLSVPAEVATALRAYIDKQGLSVGDYLFPGRNGPLCDFSKIVGETNFRASGKRITVDMIRTIWKTSLADRDANLNTVKRMAYEMGHSVVTSLEYDKSNDPVVKRTRSGTVCPTCNQRVKPTV